MKKFVTVQISAYEVLTDAPYFNTAWRGWGLKSMGLKI
jgi:hypothetical protein